MYAFPCTAIYLRHVVLERGSSTCGLTLFLRRGKRRCGMSRETTKNISPLTEEGHDSRDTQKDPFNDNGSGMGWNDSRGEQKYLFNDRGRTWVGGQLKISLRWQRQEGVRHDSRDDQKYQFDDRDMGNHEEGKQWSDCLLQGMSWSCDGTHRGRSSDRSSSGDKGDKTSSASDRSSSLCPGPLFKFPVPKPQITKPQVPKPQVPKSQVSMSRVSKSRGSKSRVTTTNLTWRGKHGPTTYDCRSIDKKS